MRMVTPSQFGVQMGPVSSDPRVIRSNPCAGGVWSRTRGQPQACPSKRARAVASLLTCEKKSKISIRIGLSAENISNQREEVEKQWTGNMCQGIQALPRPNKLFGAQQAFGSGVRRSSSELQPRRHLDILHSSIRPSRTAEGPSEEGKHCKSLRTKGRATLSDHLISWGGWWAPCADFGSAKIALLSRVTTWKDASCIARTWSHGRRTPSQSQLRVRHHPTCCSIR